MSDEDLRTLERRAKETASGEDILAYFRAFIRTISLPNRPSSGSESRRITLVDGSAEPISGANEAAIRCLHGYLQISENGGAWTNLMRQDDRPAARPVARTPDRSLTGLVSSRGEDVHERFDEVAAQVNALTRSMRDLMQALSHSGLIYSID